MVSVLGCDSTEPASLAAGSLATTSQPIVNGTREPETVALTESQIMALGWLYVVGQPSQPFCTATLVAPNLVVTASHCVWGGSGGTIGFGVGMDPGDPEGLFASTRAFSHPQADAALILLAEDATAGDLEITPIPVNQTELEESLIDQAVQVGGYGETRDATRVGRWFATVYVTDFDSYEVVVDGRGEEGICYGDSGGPLFILDGEGNPVVVAVESWGDESCVDVDHMTRLDTVYDWMEPIFNGEYPEDPCDGVGREGRCVDNVYESCRRDELRQMDCTDFGTECVYIASNASYGCDCGEVTEDGWCNGDIAEFCWDGAIRQFNCAVFGAECGWDDDEARYTCVDVATCLAEDEAGRCEGDTAVNCADGLTTRQMCALDGRICVIGDDGAECEEVVGADEGEDVGEDVDAGEVTPFPDVSEIVEDAAGDAGTPKASSDDCGCLSAPSSPAGPSMLVTLLASFVAIRRRSRRSV